MQAFDYSLDFSAIDFRKHPEWYRVGKGEQGVLLVEPYKSEILPFWRFRTPEVARASSEKIFALFLEYKAARDFVGMDMARKFLQMGWTRSRRYANHPSGKKYQENPQRAPDKETAVARRKRVLPLQEDAVKAESARIFFERYREAKSDPEYLRLLAEHGARFSETHSQQCPRRTVLSRAFQEERPSPHVSREKHLEK
ncbi:MAG: DUF4385 domain-containing protein [Candidatus Moraniibacteriota bacterium]|nr:MAG: DUF4385 domain-containing protein [Candidatus Moranbacteria bacterium]